MSTIAELRPRDVNIETHPDVIFVERFNASVGTIQGRFEQVQQPQNMAAITDVPALATGTTSLRLANPAFANTLLLKNLLKINPAGYQTVFVRVYAKYEPGGVWHHNGPWLIARSLPNSDIDDCNFLPSTCCVRPAGTELFYSGMEVGHPTATLGVDCYTDWMEMKGSGSFDPPPFNGGCDPVTHECYYGNTFAPGSATLVGNQWHCLEFSVSVNPDPIQRTGTLQAWVDNEQIINLSTGVLGQWNGNIWTTGGGSTPFDGFRWRSSPSLTINQLFLDHLTDAAGAMRMSHLVAATSRVGPLSLGVPEVGPTSWSPHRLAAP
jgi:hypothetical protein